MVFEVIGTSVTALTEPMLTDGMLTDPTLTDQMLTDQMLTDQMLTDQMLTAPNPVASAPVLPAVTAPSVTHPSVTDTCVTQPAPAEFRAPARRALPRGVITQLLRSAVSLQAEGVLRTAGALAGAWGGVLDRTEWIERDARDLSVLAAAAVAAQVPLPAGVDTGAGDPSHPGSVVESLLAGHEALVRVLRQLADAADDDVSQTWRGAVTGILSRREEEILLLRAAGACGSLPADERYVRGRPPRV